MVINLWFDFFSITDAPTTQIIGSAVVAYSIMVKKIVKKFVIWRVFPIFAEDKPPLRQAASGPAE